MNFTGGSSNVRNSFLVTRPYQVIHLFALFLALLLEQQLCLVMLLSMHSIGTRTPTSGETWEFSLHSGSSLFLSISLELS